MHLSSQTTNKESSKGSRNPNSAVAARIRNKVEDFFQIRIMETVVSFYPDAATYRPLHRAKFRSGEDIAVTCSFGWSRESAFTHKDMEIEERFELRNGMVMVFGRALTSKWLHGIRPDRATGPPISVSMWCG
jgi:hypothetical protein